MPIVEKGPDPGSLTFISTFEEGVHSVPLTHRMDTHIPQGPWERGGGSLPLSHRPASEPRGVVSKLLSLQRD